MARVTSIRIPDDIDELINQQIGDTYTQKFTNLVTRCVWELPTKEAELKKVEEQIQRKQQMYQQLFLQYNKLEGTIRDLTYRVNALTTAIDQKINAWEA